MSHPPLPPSCKLFGLYHDGVAFFRYTSSGIGHTYPLEDKDERYWKNNPDVRTLAASVARCGWLDEAERIEDFESLAFHDQRMIAYENAAAWKKWSLK